MEKISNFIIEALMDEFDPLTLEQRCIVNQVQIDSVDCLELAKMKTAVKQMRERNVLGSAVREALKELLDYRTI